ncbi:MAG: polysaccharide deacetylase [Bacilli bacterium]|nr:polysaccharide deacetylase [Bacilli bacterium]
MKKYMKYVIIGVAFVLVSLITMLIVIDYNRKLDVTLIGENNIKVNYNQKYQEQGIVVKNGNKEVKRNKYDVGVSNNVDTHTLGEYEVKYEIKYHNRKYILKRKVQVVDMEAPNLIINTDVIKRDYCTKENKTAVEYHAIDNYDADITDKVEVEEKDDEIIYKVKDSSGNESVKKIKLEYDNIPEDRFVLNGSEITYVELNREYQEPGAIYLDGCGNPKKGDIKVDGSVNTKKEGEYTITYTLNGKDKLKRKVIVYEKKYAPKTIYLTFDDGPGPYTQGILDTLDKYKVKATFFVTSQFPAYQAMIGEEHKRGHRVAVHTYSHNYSIVYSSVDAYFNDFNQMNEIIKNHTGSYSNLFRFPGGSSNTVSYRYSPGVVSAIAQTANNLGYVYFDWNLDSRDAEGFDSWSIYNNVVNGTDNCSACVVLMHDVKAPTAEALDSILAELTARGYTFATLDANSPTAHHRIQN